MQRKLLKSRLDRVTVTQDSADGRSSEDVLAVDRDLLRRADIWPYEEVLAVNHTNGARFLVTVIEAEAGSGMVCSSGACSHLARQGHVISLLGHIYVSEADVAKYYQRVVTVDSKNRVVEK